MTVAELITELQKIDGNKTVYLSQTHGPFQTYTGIKRIRAKEVQMQDRDEMMDVILMGDNSFL